MDKENAFRARLVEIAGPSPDYASLAKACEISQQAVKKWFGFGGDTKDLRMGHLFMVADHFHVSARWLATGKGSKKDGDAPPPLPSWATINDRMGLLKQYSELPDDVRLQIRGMIQTLHLLQDKNYFKWSDKTQRAADARDSRPVKSRAKSKPKL